MLAGCLPGLGLLGGYPGGTGATGGQNPASAQPRGPVYGTVLGADGQPAANVKVTAYLNGANPFVSNNAAGLVGNSGAGLVGNSGAGLVGNSGGSYRVWAARERRVLDGGITVQTDAGGTFVLSPPEVGKYNVEAVLTDTSKAWKAAVDYKGGSDQTDAGKMQLAPTGSITGRVTTTEPSVTDFTATTVYIPGSSYVAVTRQDGTYTISNVPVGRFEMGAFNADLGDAKIPGPGAPNPVAVQSNVSTAAPNLVMTVHLPVLAAVYKAGTQERSDNGAAGTQIDLAGQYFAHSRGRPFQVLFNGVPAVSAQRSSDEAIRVTVPVGATNGNLLVRVGNQSSNAVAFRVIGGLTWPCPVYPVAVGASIDLAQFATASDPMGKAIVGFKDGDRVVSYPPNLQWSVQSGEANIGSSGLFQAFGPGTVVVKLQAGDLVKTCDLTLSGAPVPTPTPGSATPTPAPTPSPSPSPTPIPSPTPTQPPPSLELAAAAFEGIGMKVGITVQDAAARGTGGSKSSVQVVLTSATETTGETVTLAETIAGSGTFSGMVSLRRLFAEDGAAQAMASDGQLTVYAEGGVVTDAITVTYGSLVKNATYAEPSNTVTGIVDVGGSVVGGAQVELLGAQGFRRVTASRSDGSYAFHDVPSGLYLIVAQAKGSTRMTIPVTVQ